MSRSSTLKKKTKAPKRKKPAGKIKPKKATKPAKKKTSAKKIKKSTPKKVKLSKKTAKKSAKQPTIVKAALAALPVAEVTHYFPNVNAAVLKIKVGNIRIGDELHFKGHSTDFKEKVTSMQIDHKPISIAQKGDDFGLEVTSRVRAGDLVFKK